VHRRLVVSYLRVGKAVDEAVGRLVDWVDTNGLRETTVVVYTSDQGYLLGQHQWYDKRYMHEPSIRAPLLLRYPPEVGAGSRASPLLLNVDIAPTLLDFAGVSAASSPDLRRMQGASFRRILAAAATPPHAAVRAAAAAAAAEPAGWRHAAYYRYFWDPFVPGVPGHFGLRTRAHKLIVYDGWIHGKGGECTGGALAFEGATSATGGGGGEGATSDTGGDGGGDGGDATGGGGGGGDAALVPFLGCFELFDLEADASERHNLAGRAEHAPTVQRLLVHLLKLQAELGDSPLRMPPGLRLRRPAQARLLALAAAVGGKGAASAMLQAHAAMNHSDVPAQYEGLQT